MKKKRKKGINAPGNGCLTLLVRAAKQALVGQIFSQADTHLCATLAAGLVCRE